MTMNTPTADATAESPQSQASSWSTVILPSTMGDDYSTVLTGVRLAKSMDHRLVVCAVDRQLQEEEPALAVLQLGMEILKINNVDTPALTIVEETDDSDVDPLTCNRTRIKGLEDDTSGSSLLTLIVRAPAPATCGLFVHVIYKPTVNTTVGIVVWQADPQVDTGYVLITDITRNPVESVAAPTIQPGMRIISINNQLQYNCRETADLIRTTQGLLTLLVQLPQETRPLHDPVTATFPLFVFESYKNNHSKDLGLTLELVDGRVVITQLSRVFVAIKNELRVGMELLSINNVKVETPKMAHTLLTGAVACAKPKTVITLLAQHIIQARPGTLVTASVIKPANDSKLGLIQGMQMPEQRPGQSKTIDYANLGHVVIRRISEGGLIAKMAASNHSQLRLEPGMILHQITIQDKTHCLRGMHNKQVSALLSTAGRGCTVTFLAEVPTVPSSPGELYPPTSLPPHIFSRIGTVAMTKRLPDQSLGMTLSKPDGTPQVMVLHVEQGGLAAQSGVQVGMQIVQVNNAYTQSVLEVVNLLQNVPPGVPISLLVLRDAASFIPPVVTGTMYKETKSSKVGIKVRKYKGGSAIVEIKENSISSNTDLLGGLLIQAINNVQGEDIIDTEKAAQMLIEGKGDITILAVTPEHGLVHSAPYVTATILLSDETALQEDIFSYEGGKVWISEPGARGLFSGSALRVGMEVISLNNVDCSLLAKPEGLMTMFEKRTENRSVVTILALEARLPPDSALVTATVFKETCDSKIGISYVVDNLKKRTIVTRLEDGALAATTRVLPGMELLTVNNSPIQGLDREGAAKLFAEASGIVNYVGINPNRRNNWSPDGRILITVTLDKTDNPGPVGIKVIRDHYDNAVIADIKENSLAASSDLVLGLILRSINNISCNGKSASEVMELLKKACGRVTILTEANPLVGKLVTGTMVKATPESKLGITMIQRNNRILIKRMAPDLLAELSGLEVGMWIIKINNKDVSGASVIYAAKLLSMEHPVVTILAETTTETFDEEEKAEEEKVEEEEMEVEKKEVENKGESEFDDIELGNNTELEGKESEDDEEAEMTKDSSNHED